jgi:nitrite reductase/ring-hydroxylating ferredoxin subunit
VSEKTHVRIGDLDDFVETDRIRAEFGDVEIVAFRCGDDIVAYENRCPHLEGPVCDGKLFWRVEATIDEDRNVVEHFAPDQLRLNCPWHGFEFDIRTGTCPVDPRFRLRRYETVVRDGTVYAVA